MKNVLRNYRQDDEEEVLAVFRSNVPFFFEASEENPFVEFMRSTQDNYWVLQKGNEVIAGGGYRKQGEGEARICWLMVKLEYHRGGAGKRVMQKIEKTIKSEKSYQKISLMTTQKAALFYKQLGYTTSYVKKDYWTTGLDLYFMEKEV